MSPDRSAPDGCLSLDSYIKPQLSPRYALNSLGCLSLDSYIKPQRSIGCSNRLTVVYLLIPTSNHNWLVFPPMESNVVYLLIPTSNHNVEVEIHLAQMLFISWFLHQTTTFLRDNRHFRRCLSLDSYIKPQRLPAAPLCWIVVYLLIPTSNHNYRAVVGVFRPVVYLLIPTSNHNWFKNGSMDIIWIFN